MEKKNSSYTKAELVADIADKTGVSKAEAELAVLYVARVCHDVLLEKARTGNKVGWPGFGMFETTQRAARAGRNPHTGETIQIEASTAMKFTDGCAPSSAKRGEAVPLPPCGRPGV